MPRAGFADALECRREGALGSLHGSAARGFADEGFSMLLLVLFAVTAGVQLSAIAESAKRPLRKGLLDRLSGEVRSSVATVVVVVTAIALGLHGASPTEEFLRAYLGANIPLELSGAFASPGRTNAYGLSTCFS